ncbi:nucleoside hydrolase [Amnibacterium sp. CER49]|uniref:nucleoside hydrolase n=1 Tax=Amnibacterium sp. CER49 TaxID=3039161 RepID=UPI002448BA28|nr:nucleoside hydrolase [Amnibacterium sp. CER49]MDH2443752.1 nucleoside hydrolase [Amnibacterium sp. CER49]
MPALPPLVLDTDLGSDVDDLLALAVLLGSPEVTITGVTTVYGDTALRARIAARAFRLAGRTPPSIVPGLAQPRSGREVWWAGHEGEGLEGLDEERIDEHDDAVALLAAAEHVVAIGPLTDLAAAVEEPGCSLAGATLMGGDFGPEARPEHNLRSDAAAADLVLRSGLELTIAGLDVTERVSLGEAEVGRIASSGLLGELLAAQIRTFWRFLGEARSSPHDPIAVLTLLQPDLFEFRRGRIDVETAGDAAGRVSLTEDPAGPHRVAVDLDADAVREEILTRILAATR